MRVYLRETRVLEGMSHVHTWEKACLEDKKYQSPEARAFLKSSETVTGLCSYSRESQGKEG